MAAITITGLTKRYADGTLAVQDFNLEVADGEFLVMVGPSGCGKTTVLRCVAGLETPTAGAISLDGRVINDLPPQARDLAMVFQTFALYPHMTVFDNLAFGLKMQRQPRPEVERRVGWVAEKLGISGHLRKKPKELSGGEQQRVALGRAMVRQPRAFLMDEPLSNLDAALRVQMRTEIARLQRELGATMLYVTHDQTEALTMGDRVAVLHQGRLQQVARPRELYERPANRWVAGFIGSPAMNFLSGRLRRREGGLALEFAGQTLALPPGYGETNPELLAQVGKPVIIGFRPEHIREVQAFPPDASLVRITVAAEAVEVTGPVNYLHFSLTDTLAPGEPRVSLVAAISPGLMVGIGQSMELGVDLWSLHFFEGESGRALPLLPSGA